MYRSTILSRKVGVMSPEIKSETHRQLDGTSNVSLLVVSQLSDHKP